VNPTQLAPDRENHIYLRSMIVKSDAVLELRLGDRVVLSKKERHIQPSEMICLKLDPEFFKDLDISSESILEFCIR
jgi:hypothetical protein